MTGGEGFAKVMQPLVFPWCLIYFGIDKVPHLHINFKISEGIKSPWQRTTLLVSALHCITFSKDWLLEFFWWSRSWDSEASIAGAVTLAIGIGIQNFPEGIAVSMPLRRMGMSRWKVLCMGNLPHW
jgi:ZIP family zinc transporter